MTFKHSKFEDSVTMRSLERIARENGWVKPEKITKSASSKVDLAPSASLVENVLKLCSGLKNAGFDKYADELEGKFLAYKQAQTLYEVSKEKGDDLVEAAHPKGSHKLENVDSSEAVFEDILDKHLKHVEVAEKAPTGKLASSRGVISAVKMVLAQGALSQQLFNVLSQFKSLGREVVNLTESDLTESWSHFTDAWSELAEDPKVDNLKKIKDKLSKQIWRLKPGYVFGVTEDTWYKIQPKLASMQTLIDNAIALRVSIVQGKDTPEAPAATEITTPAATEITTPAKQVQMAKGDDFASALRKVNNLTTAVNSWKKDPRFASKALQDWFNDEIVALGKISDTYSTMNDAGGGLTVQELERMNKEIATEEGYLDAFAQHYGANIA